MKALRAAAAVLVLVFLLAPAAAFAVTTNVSVVQGKDPVGGATISFTTPSGTPLGEARTDDDGNTSVDLPDEGVINIAVTANGRTHTTSVDLSRGFCTDLWLFSSCDMTISLNSGSSTGTGTGAGTPGTATVSTGSRSSSTAGEPKDPGGGD